MLFYGRGAERLSLLTYKICFVIVRLLIIHFCSGQKGSRMIDHFEDGFAFLDKLREIGQRKNQTFADFTVYLDEKARKTGIPLHGQFELTPHCNFDCKMCYVHLNPDQAPQSALLSAEQWKSLMYEAFQAGMLTAVLTGGECFTYPDFRSLYLYLKSLGVEITLLTNGSLLDREWISFFQEHRPAQIQITLYGSSEEAYESVTGRRLFGKVLENIRLVTQAGLPLHLNVTPSVYMAEDVFHTIRLAKRLCRSVRVNSSVFRPREETGRSRQDDNLNRDYYLRIYHLLKELDGEEIIRIPEDRLPPPGGPAHDSVECGLDCGGGRSGFVIDWKGIMHPCNRLYILEGFPLTSGFDSAFRTIYAAVCQWPKAPACKGCVYRFACNNCAANMLAYAEPGKQPLKLCEQTRFFVHNGVGRLSDCE